MVEMRIIDHGPMCRPEFQYRYHLLTTDASGGLCPACTYETWSQWQTAEWVKAEDESNV